MKRFIILILLSSPFLSVSQVEISRHVISPLSLNGMGTLQISSTLGQVEYKSGESDDHIVHQGFEQSTLRTREFSYHIDLPECDNGEPAILNIHLDSVCTDGLGEILVDGFPEENLVELEESGTYEIDITCDNGSIFNESITYLQPILGPCDLIFYNVITPANEIFYWPIDNIETGEYIENEVKIYNRWGDMIWEGENYNNDDVRWEGKDLNGEDLPVGTYYYVVEIGDELFKGFIELIR